MSEEVFTYYRCAGCGLIFMHPHPADLGRYYPAEYYGATRTVADLEPELPIERYKLDLLRPFASPGARLLEVGPSRGAFAYLAKTEGSYGVEVIERDPECCRFLSGVVGIHTIQEADPAAALRQEPGSYDVIALWQVIEHLPEPWEFVRVAAGKLRPGGVLVLATPNPESLQFRIFGRQWAHLDAPRHLQLIPASLLVRLGRELGLREVLCTAADAGVVRHNDFGWVQSVIGGVLRGRGRARRLAAWLMKAFARGIRGFEHRGFRGCTYTLILRREG